MNVIKSLWTTVTGSKNSRKQEDELSAWKLWFGRFVRGSIVFMVLFAVTWLALNHFWRKEFEQQLHEARESGLYKPIEQVEREHMDHYPDRSYYDKTDPVLQADAHEKLSNWNQQAEKKLRYMEAYENDRKTVIKNLLESVKNHQDEIDRLIQADPKPAALRITQGLSTRLPHVQHFLFHAETLYHYGHVHLHAGDPEEAIRAMKGIRKRLNAIQADPFLISFLSGSVIFEHLWKLATTYIKKHPAKSGNKLSFLPDRLDPKSWRDQFKRVMKTEFAVAVQAANELSIRWMKSPSNLKPWERKSNPIAFALKPYYEKSKAAMVMDYKQSLLHLYPDDPLYKHHSEIRKSHKQVEGRTGGFFRKMTRLIFPDFLKGRQSLAEQVARIHLLAIAIRAERNRNDDGSLPDPLPGYRKKLDPFSGNPFKTRQTKNFVVLSCSASSSEGENESVENGKTIQIKLKKKR